MIKTTLVPIAIILLVTISSISADNFDLKMQSSTTPNDIPTWYIGEHWTYTISPLSYTSPNGSFTGTINNLRQTITDITTINHYGKSITSYEITLVGSITGELTFEGITGDLQGTITGTSYARQADLAELSTSIFSSGTVTVLFIQQPYTLNSFSDFNPTFELYDFPLQITEQWNTNTYSTNTGSFQIGDLINETFTSNTWINETITCPTQETITVPAGTFNTFKINHGSTDAWYSPEVKNVIKSHISQTSSNTSLEMTLSLTDYTLTTQETTLTAVSTPSPAIIDQPVSITGTATDTTTSQPLEGATITLTIPATSDQYITTTNHTGGYKFTITTPYIIDNTPTTYDIGSDGIHINCQTSKESNTYILTTLSVRINTPPTAPIITGKTHGQANKEYTYTFQSTDAESDDIYIMVDWGDNTQTNWLGPYQSAEDIKLSHTWTQEDTYLIRAKTKDSYQAESNWTTLDIQMPHPYSQNYRIYNLILRIVAWFQNFEPYTH